MLHDQLLALAEPVLTKVQAHPFWSGLRDGSLPAECLAHFVEQDATYLLPAYGRAQARCAHLTRDNAHAVFFARAIGGTAEAANRLRSSFAEVAPRVGVDPASGRGPIGPLTHAHCCFFEAATAHSLHAAVGALLPMTWFNYHVSRDLAERHSPDSRYAGWIAAYQPADGYFEHVVRPYLDLVDELGQRCSEEQRATLVEHWSIGLRYEWMFADGAWRRPAWPV